MSGNAKKPFNPIEKCAELKKNYDLCFKKWYSTKFLKGNVEVSEDCEEEFEALSVCINKAIEDKRKERMS